MKRITINWNKKKKCVNTHKCKPKQRSLTVIMHRGCRTKCNKTLPARRSQPGKRMIAPLLFSTHIPMAFSGTAVTVLDWTYIHTILNASVVIFLNKLPNGASTQHFYTQFPLLRKYLLLRVSTGNQFVNLLNIS